MKKFILLFATLLVSISSFAQNLKIKDKYSGEDITGKIITINYDNAEKFDEYAHFLHFTNKSGNDMGVLSKKIHLEVADGHEISFDTDQHYSHKVFLSMGTMDIKAGETFTTASVLLKPRFNSGTSRFKFVIFDENNPVDSAFVEYHINVTVTSLKDQIKNKSKISNVYPNPVKNTAIVDYKLSPKTTSTEAIIYDVLGNEIKREKISNLEGSLEINTERMNNGIYFLKIVSDNIELTNKKIIVNK